jgi:hypothetical protein
LLGNYQIAIHIDAIGFPCRSTPLGMMILKHKSIGYFFFDTIEAYGNPTCPKDSSLVMKWAL